MFINLNLIKKCAKIYKNTSYKFITNSITKINNHILLLSYLHNIDDMFYTIQQQKYKIKQLLCYIQKQEKKQELRNNVNNYKKNQTQLYTINQHLLDENKRLHQIIAKLEQQKTIKYFGNNSFTTIKVFPI